MLHGADRAGRRLEQSGDQDLRDAATATAGASTAARSGSPASMRRRRCWWSPAPPRSQEVKRRTDGLSMFIVDVERKGLRYHADREARHQHAVVLQRVLRGRARRRRRTGRHARQGLARAARRAQHRAHRHHRRPGRRGHARASGIGGRLRERATRVRRQADRRHIRGCSFRSRKPSRRSNARRLMNYKAASAVRPGPALRHRGQRRQADRLAGGLGGIEHAMQTHGRHGLRQGDAPGAAVARCTPVPLRADLRADDPQLHRPAKSRIAAVLLNGLRASCDDQSVELHSLSRVAHAAADSASSTRTAASASPNFYQRIEKAAGYPRRARHRSERCRRGDDEEQRRFPRARLRDEPLGAVFLPINFRLAADEVDYIVGNAGAKLLFADAEFAAVVKPLSLRQSSWTSRRRSTPRSSPPALRPRPCICASLTNLFRLMYTSGTTDRPKGVMHTYANFYWKCMDHVIALGLGRATRVCSSPGRCTTSAPSTCRAWPCCGSAACSTCIAISMPSAVLASIAKREAHRRLACAGHARLDAGASPTATAFDVSSLAG